MRVYQALLILLVFLTLPGCGKKDKTPPPPPPTTIDAQLITSEDVNPDNNSRPSPIVVRVYQLKSNGVFDLTDFDTLYFDDKHILSEDIISRNEFHMKPGDVIEYQRKPEPQARYLAVIGAYRNINNAVWKKSLLIPEHQTSLLTIQLNALGIEIIRQNQAD